MPDLVLGLLLVAAILLVADVVRAGGAMTMAEVSVMAGAAAQPLTAGALLARAELPLGLAFRREDRATVADAATA